MMDEESRGADSRKRRQNCRILIYVRDFVLQLFSVTSKATKINLRKGKDFMDWNLLKRAI